MNIFFKSLYALLAIGLICVLYGIYTKLGNNHFLPKENMGIVDVHTGYTYYWKANEGYLRINPDGSIIAVKDLPKY